MTPATLERRMVEPLLLDTIRAMRAEQQQGRFRKVTPPSYALPLSCLYYSCDSPS